jgi:N-acetyltransferase
MMSRMTTPTDELDRQPTLVGTHLTLRPLRDDDFDELYAIASDPLLWEQHPAKDRAQEPVFRQWMVDALASGGALVATDHSGRIVATSRYASHAGDVEIGWTFIARELWGSGANDEMKQLMLRHAFATVDTVVFRVHSENFRSQRAVMKLGATQTGTEVDPNGYGTNLVFSLSKP